MTEFIREKLEKVYRLVNQGATEGERAAAKKALDRLMDKYNLDDAVLNEIELSKHEFKYSMNIEYILLIMIVRAMISEDAVKKARRSSTVKRIVFMLKYIDFVTVDSAYEYFRRHMKKEFKRTIIPALAKCRTAKTKRQRRKKLDMVFMEQYTIKSKLYLENDIAEVTVKGKKLDDYNLVRSVEGGEYNKQVVGGLLLTE